MRKKILWLCSWYPTRIDPFDGDFVQRHAQAASLYNDIHVIKVVGDEKGSVTQSVSSEISQTGGLTEQRIYYRKNGSWPGKIFAASKWLALNKRAIRDYIETNGKPHLIHVHIPMRAGLAALWAKRKFQLPYVVSEHWTIYQPGTPGQFSRRNPLFKSLTRKIFRSARLTISVSKDLGEKIQQAVPGVEYSIVPNVANTELFQYEPVETGDFVFVHVSNMSFQKNIETIINAFEVVNRKNPKTKLVIVGPRTPALEAAVSERRLLGTAIFLRGEISYGDVAKELHHANVFVLASLFENQPCVIIEALCAGLPVISTPVGGIPEIIDSSNGILANNSVEGIAGAMEEMMRDFGKLDRARIAREAAKKYSYPVVGRLLDEIYQQII